MRPRWRKLSAQHWTQAGWLGPRRIGPNPLCRWPVDGQERAGNLREQSLPTEALKLCELYSERKYALRSRSFLAWQLGGSCRSYVKSEVGETAGDRAES